VFRDLVVECPKVTLMLQARQRQRHHAINTHASERRGAGYNTLEGEGGASRIVEKPSMAEPLLRVDGRVRVKSMRQLFRLSLFLEVVGRR
jgi:hypothetical protein